MSLQIFRYLIRYCKWCFPVRKHNKTLENKAINKNKKHNKNNNEKVKPKHTKQSRNKTTENSAKTKKQLLQIIHLFVLIFVISLGSI